MYKMKNLKTVKVIQQKCINGCFKEITKKENKIKECVIVTANKIGRAHSSDYISDNNLYEYAIKKASDTDKGCLEQLLNQQTCTFETKNYDDWNSNEITNLIKDIDQYICIHNSKLSQRAVIINIYEFERQLESSIEVNDYYIFNRMEIYIFFELNNISLHEFIDGYPNEIFNDLNRVYDVIDKLYINILKKSVNQPLENNNSICIIDSSVTGLLIHETIGHLAEADIYEIAGKPHIKLGERVCNNLITIKDYAHQYKGYQCPFPVHVDDEGIIAKDVSIIENGIFTDLMHNLRTANCKKVQSSGNARSYTGKNLPYVRMRNTCLLDGNSTLDEMIASIENGYYLFTPGFGMTNVNGYFKIEIVLGFEIKNSKIGRTLNHCFAYGNVKQFLNSIDMVSNRSKLTGSICKKKNNIYIGMGGPALRCRLLLKNI